MRLLEDLGLIPYLQNLTEHFDMPLVLQAKRSYNNDNMSIRIQTPQGNIQEIILSSDIIHYALGLPAVGAVRATTAETKQHCVPYFQNLVGTCRDGHPLANIIDPNLRLVAEAVSNHVEISRAERKGYIHARLFCPIPLLLNHNIAVHWASLAFEELKKGLKSTRNFIAYGPHLTQIITWCLNNPGVHLGGQQIPQNPILAEPRQMQPDEEFVQQQDANIKISDFIAENVEFAVTEQSAADLGPSGSANPAEVQGPSQRAISEENLRREREERLAR